MQTGVSPVSPGKTMEEAIGRAVGALSVVCTYVTTLHSCYIKNALVFSQSEAVIFFMYIITQKNS